MFTSNRRLMGEFVNPVWLKFLAWGVTIVIVGLNTWLLLQSLLGLLHLVP
jgi:manganese transport protein